MSKLSKFFKHPVQFWSDALLNRVRASSPEEPEEDVRLTEARRLFRNGQSHRALEVLSQLENPCGNAHLLEAQLDFFASRFDYSELKCCRAMSKLLPRSASFQEAFYLRIDALRFMGQYEESRKALQNIPFKDASNRYFRTLRLCVDRKEHVRFYSNLFLKYGQGVRGNDRAVFNYSILMRDLGLHEEAIEFARARLIETMTNRKFGSKAKRQTPSWCRDAQVALSDLHNLFSRNGIEFFLISGTLLGCVRDGAILGHDKDIDVGVDERFSFELLRQIILEAPSFRLLEIPYEGNVYAQHANGVLIDIFKHYEQDGLYFHEGLKVRWWNTPFNLKKVDFLGGSYLIPEDYNRYLEENYGDWHTPQPEFETFVDTPNMQVTDPEHLMWYYLNKLSDYYLAGKFPQFFRVWSAYSGLRNDPFLEREFVNPLAKMKSSR